MERLYPKWEGEAKEGWQGKCEVCWGYYMRGIQHPNSLKCWKLGIPFSALKDIDKAIELTKKITKEIGNSTYKYMVNQGFLKPFTKGIIIAYFESKEDMNCFISRFLEEGKDILKQVNIIERFFYTYIVNTDDINRYFYIRRGCPEYDRKFGDWRKWENE